MIRPVAVSLRLLAVIAVAGVRIVVAVVGALAEFFSILAEEVMGPAQNALERAEENLKENARGLGRGVDERFIDVSTGA